MKVVHELLLGIGALVGVAASTGAFTLSRVHHVDSAIARDVSLNLAAADYARGAGKVRLAAQMRALGSNGGEPLRREGSLLMRQARLDIARATNDPALNAQLTEMERVEHLTTEGTDLLFAGEVKGAQIDARVLQRLNFVEARAEALGIGLETFSAKRRAHVEASLRSMAAMQSVVAAVVAASVIFALLVALGLARRISRPIQLLSRGVQALSSGDFEHVIRLESRDEMGAFAAAFNHMTSNLREIMQRIEQRNRDMSRVLNNVSEGLVTIDTAGIMSAERSQALTTWFGPGQPGQTLWAYLSPINHTTAECMRVGFEMLLEDVMPVEVAIGQMPRRLVQGERTWELAYCPIYEADRIVNLLVVVDDATERLKTEHAEGEQRAFIAIIELILKDRGGTVSFIEEASELVLSIAGAARVPREVLARQLHTLKGNASIFGLKPLAALCHELEDKLVANSGESVAPGDRERLRAAWTYWTGRLAVFLNDGVERGISINASEYEQMLVAVIKNVPHMKLAEMLARLRLVPTHERLSRLGEQATALAARLDKGQLSVSVEDNGVRLPAEGWQSFWSSLAHVVRNAVDHGLEGTQERSLAGKGTMPSLALSSRYAGDSIVVEIADDGRGIDWARVAEKARSQGLPSADAEQLKLALFADGFSTRDEVTDLSGRGVGLAAARAECERLGGKVEVESKLGQGTMFRFRLPTPRMDEIEPRLRSVSSTRLAV
jgi:HAMP domain-containing protein/HPt (histidine-containing phosphotransfer) domain-containing protein/two-component sensor histidine kinase